MSKLFESGEVNAEVPEGFALVSRSSVTGNMAEGLVNEPELSFLDELPSPRHPTRLPSKNDNTEIK